MAPSGTGRRSDFPYIQAIPTRWADNDIYGHVNNVTYYAFFDTTVNHYLLANGVLDPHAGDVVGLVVETGCRYYKPIAFPDQVSVGLRVARVGRSSVRYELGIFRNAEGDASAEGHFVHVYVSRDDRRPVSVPKGMRRALAVLQSKG